MTTAYSSLLGLALPVQGELAGQWGDTVNDYITKYLDASIAGSLSITADVTLTKTTGTTLGATSSQYAILTCSPSSVNIVVTAPAAYKIYVVNNTSASYTVTIRGAGPTSGVVLAALEKAVVAWNGSDFFKVATSATDGVSTFSAGSTGLTPNSATAGAVTLAGTLAVANGGTGITSFGTGVATALGVNTGSAGAFVVNGGALGTPSSGTVTNLTGTASININGTVGATTATTGAFTTVTASTSAAIGSTGALVNGELLKVAGKVYINAAESDIVFTAGAALIFPGTYNSFRQGTDHSFNLDTYNGGLQTNVLKILQNGNTAVTGTLSATGKLSAGGATYIPGNFSAWGAADTRFIIGADSSGNINSNSPILSFFGYTTNAGLAGPSMQAVSAAGYGRHDLIFYQHGGADYTSEVEAFRITYDNKTVPAGLLDLSAATAGQIKFPATQNASADANTLDDYEEGDWTPSLTFGGGSTGITYDTTNTTATYRKIGSLVMITGYLGLTSKGSSTGDARINTLPFPVKSGKEGYSPVAANRTDSIISIGTINPIAFAGTSGLYFYSTSAAGVATSITDTGFANNSTIYFSFSYATS